MHSLKTKLIAWISVLIIILFGISAWLFLGEKQRELTQDIFVNARSFAELTAGSVVADYKLYLPQESFVYFNREIKSTFAKFQDLAGIKVISYKGELVYDSATEAEKQYLGATRMVVSEDLLKQVASRNPSVMTFDGKRVVYLKKNDDGSISYVDENEMPVLALGADEKIAYLVQPASNDYAVVYGITYENLQERVNQTIMRSLLLALFGVGTGILIAYFFAAGITKPLKELTAGAGIIAKGNFRHRVPVKTKDEIAVLAGAFNSMAQELEVSTKALIYKERVAKELEIAASIQKDLLPKVIPAISGLDISAGLIPAEEIGGDCYDFLKPNEDNLLMYLGDVTGHGVASGIVGSIVNALIYNYADVVDMKDLLVRVNKILKAKTMSNMFITMVMLRWDAAAAQLKYISAGHEQLIYFRAKDGSVSLLPPGGLALGMMPDIAHLLNEQLVVLEEGDVIVAYSDGIPEAWKNEKDIYCIERLLAVVEKFGKMNYTAEQMRKAIIDDVTTFREGYEQMDDITIMVIKRR